MEKCIINNYIPFSGLLISSVSPLSQIVIVFNVEERTSNTYGS